MTSRLESLRHRYKERCSGDLAVLQQLLKAPDAISETDLKTLLHQMSGSATAFGFPQLSILAMRLERQLADDAPPSRELVQTLIDELGAI